MTEKERADKIAEVEQLHALGLVTDDEFRMFLDLVAANDAARRCLADASTTKVIN